jgi:hypothetical protein
MSTVEEAQRKEMHERAESWIAQDFAVSHETAKKKVRVQGVSDSEISQSEYITLVGQCSILVVIGGIVAALLAA